MSNSSDILSGLASQLSQLATSQSSDAEKNDAAIVIGQRVIDAARGPMPDWMDRAIHAMDFVGLKLFLDWKVFDMIPLDGSISYTHLAKKLEADVSLIRRLSWVLISGGILTQIGYDKVAHNEKSKLYLSGTADELFFEEHIITALKLPEYFAKYGRREPATRAHTPYSFARGRPEKEIWELHRENPEQVKRFMKGMEMAQQFVPLEGIYDFGWVESKLSEGNDSPVFVDVGGSKGHAIKAILEENPFLPAERVILQDRDEVIEQVAALKDPGLEHVKLQVHDFHAEQPVKNALIYWIRRCLHDYGDDDSVKILSRLSDAMGWDSKVLVVEYVLQNPPPSVGAMTDFGMMNIGGKERTAADWESVVARAGLKIERIHGLEKKMQVIECSKA
ncbi:Putative O-methyltransferase domain, S-adenosyl-L-methionine-dependent methyltransferase superfamily [Colletotrichum destructivum]|uniref:O-methyltransferase domain, S-adenosyl-L-methionine-dependent methyltransferase superfamily n=1 Tax=Colletotrichum destructivum TaxID=34406 RepID=A0AAX4J3Y0_9PEZI|nr:Putative O-methyltransferase domain, S-adenosyl-L-methionine-dependent methyltransferase superfamily [Colletotrichum destructivum]